MADPKVGIEILDISTQFPKLTKFRQKRLQKSERLAPCPEKPSFGHLLGAFTPLRQWILKMSGTSFLESSGHIGVSI